MARSTREAAQANRDRVLSAATGLLNERGVNGIGVADLMAAAGMTHGGFYRHFASKEDVVAAATERSLGDVTEQWASVAAHAKASGHDPLHQIVSAYLSPAHRKAPGKGCSVAAIGSELARLPDGTRWRITQAVDRMVAALADAAPEATPAERHRRALTALSTMVGAVVLARLDVGQGENVLELAADAILHEH